MLRSVLQKFGKVNNPDTRPGKVRDIRQENDRTFLEDCRGALEALEIIRKTKLKIYNFRKSIGIPAAAILTPPLAYLDYWLVMLQRGDDDSFAGLSALFLFLLYRWVTKPKREYAKAYKREILPRLAKLFGDFTYALNAQISMRKMEPSKIVPRHDKYDHEDYFAGEYKGVEIEFSEINLKQKRRSKKRTYYVSVFKGLAVLLNLPHKKFYGHTILDKDKSKLGEWFEEKSTQLKRARMVDPEFEKVFDAYTSDQVEARYLIDPLMIENLKTMYEEYNGEKMAAAFYDSKMLILIASNHNHFEPADLHVPATDTQSVMSMKHEIGQILSIVDKLSLYDPQAVREQEQLQDFKPADAADGEAVA